MNKVMFAGMALAAVLAVTTSSSFAATAADVKACASSWDQMKTANTVPVGTTWKTYEKDCLAKADAAAAKPAAPAAAAPAAPAAAAVAPKAAAPAAMAPAPKAAAPAAMAPAPKAAAPAAAATGGQPAEQSRIKACAAEWDAMKAANKVPAGLKWPQFWHECDVKMKAAGK